MKFPSKTKLQEEHSLLTEHSFDKIATTGFPPKNAGKISNLAGDY